MRGIMIQLLRSLVSSRGLNDAHLPYNINWMIKNVAPVKTFLSKCPLVVADIGARGGSLAELRGLTRFMKYYAFDADTSEVQRQRQRPPKDFHSYHIFPYYVGHKNEIVDFNIFDNAGHSSLYEPSARFQKLFSRYPFGIKETVKVESKTLDSIIRDEELDFPDMIKLDTQGTELEILKNAEEAVRHATMIEIEVEIIEMYRNQPLMHDVMKYMYDHGFEMLYFNRVFGSRIAYLGKSRGQLIFGDALFGRTESSLDSLSMDRIAKYAIMLVNYGLVDFAHHLMCTKEGLDHEIPGIRHYFYSKSPDWLRFLMLQLDKILCFILHLRKTNNQLMDSDRSWPTR